MEPPMDMTELKLMFVRLFEARERSPLIEVTPQKLTDVKFFNVKLGNPARVVIMAGRLGQTIVVVVEGIKVSTVLVVVGVVVVMVLL